MKKFPVHLGEDGRFQELIHDDEVKFGQLSILTVNPKCSRGGHYHKRKIEWFCPISGKGILELIDLLTGKKMNYILNGINDRKFYEVGPNIVHTVINRDPYVDFEVLIIISEKFNSEDPDTFNT